MESLLEKTDNQLMSLERLVMDIEFAQVEANVMEGLQVGNEALKQIHSILSIERIEEIMEETREGIEKQRVSLISSLLYWYIDLFPLTFFCQ